MKKFILVLIILLFPFFTTSAFSDTLTAETEGADLDVTQIMSGVSADFSGTDLEDRMSGGFLYQVGIKTTLDESVTFTVTSASGFPLFSESWTAAATGEEPKLPSGFFWIPTGSTPNATLSGLGSGTATIEITILKK